jgi:hypothetical protein
MLELKLNLLKDLSPSSLVRLAGKQVFWAVNIVQLARSHVVGLYRLTEDWQTSTDVVLLITAAAVRSHTVMWTRECFL